MATYPVLVIEGEQAPEHPEAAVSRGLVYDVPAQVTSYHMLQSFLERLLSVPEGSSFGYLREVPMMGRTRWTWAAFDGIISHPEKGFVVRISKPISRNNIDGDVILDLRNEMAVPARPLPALLELRSFIRRPPESRFPVPQKLYFRLPSHNRAKIFRLAGPQEDSLTIVRFVQNLIEPPAAGGSEDNFHHLYDSLISDVLEFFFGVESWNKTRNQASSGVLWPDMVARFARLYALFRGEEKGPRSRGDPAKELTYKMEWTYGTSIPYVLGYHATEYLVTFCSLRCKDGVNLRDDMVTLNLLKATDRVELFIVCLNLARLLATLRDLCISNTVPADMTEIQGENGKLVQIYGKKVVKLYDEFSRFARVLNIYNELKGCPYAEVLLHHNNQERSLVMERGLAEERPGSVALLVECLRCILLALVWLHDKNLMHRDLRWENVARVYEGGGWFLLDFDEACRSPSEGPHRLRPETHATEMNLRRHTTSVDVWGVGYLLASWRRNGLLPDGLEELKRRCLDAEPEKRPTARDCFAVIEPIYELFFLKGSKGV